jgi:hypothetical protein
MTRRYRRILDFIKLHYFLSAAHRHRVLARQPPASTAPTRCSRTFRCGVIDPESFRFHDGLRILRARELPVRAVRDGIRDFLQAQRASYPHRARARGIRAGQDAAKRAVAALPAHRELLQRVNQAGFSFAEPANRPTQPMLVR